MPPRLVWVDLKSLLHKPGVASKHVPGGVFVAGHERGYLWGWVASDDGLWLGVVSLELRRGGRPVMTAQALVPHWALIPRATGNLDRDLRAAGRYG